MCGEDFPNLNEADLMLWVKLKAKKRNKFYECDSFSTNYRGLTMLVKFPGQVVWIVSQNDFATKTAN